MSSIRNMFISLWTKEPEEVVDVPEDEDADATTAVAGANQDAKQDDGNENDSSEESIIATKKEEERKITLTAKELQNDDEQEAEKSNPEEGEDKKEDSHNIEVTSFSELKSEREPRSDEVWWEKPQKAEGEERFWIDEGPVVSSLLELKNAFRQMNEEQFEYHVNEEKNDFADWVEHVLENNKCASALREAKNSEEAIDVISQYT